MSGNYIQRQLKVTFSLSTGAFGQGKPDTVTLSGLRVRASIQYSGTPMTLLNLRVYGMTSSKMHQLSTLGMLVQAIEGKQNKITLQAGDDKDGFSTVFIGTINAAWIDTQGMPDVFFQVMANSAYFENMTPVLPNSYPGSADVATIMKDLAGKMNMQFENNGVQARLSNPYLSGTAYSQATAVADAAGINMVVENNVLAIWPRNAPRGGLIPLVAPRTGMIGYPTYTANGVQIRTVYNPNIRMGSKVKVESDFPQATGEWVAYNIMHELESETPGGNWMTQFDGTSAEFYATGAALPRVG